MVILYRNLATLKIKFLLQKIEPTRKPCYSLSVVRKQNP